MSENDDPIPDEVVVEHMMQYRKNSSEALPNAVHNNKQTAIKARNMLLDKDTEFRVASPKQKRILLVEFARIGRVIYGQAFDMIKLGAGVDLDNAASVRTHLRTISLYEVKSTNRILPPNFDGFFFSLSTAELFTAQSLGSRYRFAFVNVVTGEHLELALAELFSRARSIYPTWSIRF